VVGDAGWRAAIGLGADERRIPGRRRSGAASADSTGATSADGARATSNGARATPDSACATPDSACARAASDTSCARAASDTSCARAGRSWCGHQRPRARRFGCHTGADG
jgi:hypothetical protein